MESAEIEKTLVKRLKSMCHGSRVKVLDKTFKNLKERDGENTAEIFHKLATVYESKTELVELSSIRSATLLNAAIVRDPQNEQMKTDLQKFCSAVLVKANAKKVDADLVYFSATVKSMLEQFRKKYGDSYNQLKIIPYNAEADKLLALKNAKVADVKKLQIDITRDYTELMRFVSDECIKIMGKPPCKYSLAAMGSLARSEITPYSDLEHIILLENSAMQTKDKEVVLGYFRWFSTIFHIVIINLGETMIPAVAIPTLNGENDNWFYDKFTPNGVTFDGMQAHASKIPLGRQPTENKPWKTELIKTVDEMLEHLEPVEAVKEGYYLSDMLYTTCFIAGDKIVFDEFYSKARTIVAANDKESGFSELFKQINQNFKSFDILKQQKSATVGFDIKRVIYRSATIFVSAIGRLYSMKELSCFDILDNLEEARICSKFVADRLRFIVAVACEVRFKVYQLNRSQDDIFMDGSYFKKVVQGLVGLVGKRSFVTFMETVENMHDILSDLKNKSDLDLDELQELAGHFNVNIDILHKFKLTNELVESSKINTKFQTDDVELGRCMLVLEKLLFSDSYELCLDLCKKLFPVCHAADKLKVKAWELHCKVELGHYDESEVESQIDELDELVATVVELPHNQRERHDALPYYARCLQDLDRHDHANVVWDKWLQCYEQYEQTAEGKFENLLSDHKMELIMRYSDSLTVAKDHSKALEMLHKALKLLKETEEKTIRDLYIRCDLARCYFALEKYFKAFIYLAECARMANVMDEAIDIDSKEEIQEVFERLLPQCQQSFEKMLGVKSDKLRQDIELGQVFIAVGKDKLVDCIVASSKGSQRCDALRRYAQCLQDIGYDDHANYVLEKYAQFNEQ